MRYDIVVPTYGRPELVRNCVASIVRNSSDYRLIWIDNIPQESGAAETLASLRPNVLYLPLPQNVGFTKGTNVGLAASTAPYVVLLNSDTEVPPDWLPKLESGFQRKEKVAAVGPLSSAQDEWQWEDNHAHIPPEKRRAVIFTPKLTINRVGHRWTHAVVFLCDDLSGSHRKNWIPLGRVLSWIRRGRRLVRAGAPEGMEAQRPHRGGSQTSAPSVVASGTKCASIASEEHSTPQGKVRGCAG